MNWQDPHLLASALRDQACADYLMARYLLAFKSEESIVNGEAINSAHAVVGKCQQACEKLLKAYIVYHDPSFDPSSGHQPISDLDFTNRQGKLSKQLLGILNHGNPGLVKDLKWIEAFAPRKPIPAGNPGAKQSHSIIVENCEYPYWKESSGKLVTPAHAMSINNDAIKAFKATRNLFASIANSTPYAFTATLKIFLDDTRKS